MAYNKNGIKETEDRADERRGTYFFHRLSTLFTSKASYLGNLKDPVYVTGASEDLHALKAMDVQIGKMLGHVPSGRVDDFDFEAEVQGHINDLKDVFSRVTFTYVTAPKKEEEVADTSPLGQILSFVNQLQKEKAPPEPMPQVRRLEYVHYYKAKDGTKQEQQIASAPIF